MLSLPNSRRLVLPAIALLVVVLLYRSTFHDQFPAISSVQQNPASRVQEGIRIPIADINDDFLTARNASNYHLIPDLRHYYSQSRNSQGSNSNVCAEHGLIENPYLAPLLDCRSKPNIYTSHIRLAINVQNVSSVPPGAMSSQDESLKFNPTIIALPYWSENQYLLVSRVVTDGLHQESLICEANICHPSSQLAHPNERVCTADDDRVLGPAGGLRCAHQPTVVSIPPTPAEQCTGAWTAFPDIPGFHDPRIFWSGKGEPLMIVNSASRYACVGLWMVDLRTVHEPLKQLLASQPGQPAYSHGPPMSYPHLTELTRNPASSRSAVEKNWFLFFPTPSTAYIHYDLSPLRMSNNQTSIPVWRGGRSFAKLIGNGFTTPNLTSLHELPCLPAEIESQGQKVGHWHQATNALKLVLCRRADFEKGRCSEDEDGRAVHFAIVHKKFSNQWDLPLRYERYFIVWEARPPFGMLAMSKFPMSMWNETASGWSGAENWHDEATGSGEAEDRRSRNDTGNEPILVPASSNNTRRSYNESHATNDKINTSTRFHNHTSREWQNWAYFTYTTSIAWAWRAEPNPNPVRPQRAKRREEHNHDPTLDRDGSPFFPDKDPDSSSSRSSSLRQDDDSDFHDSNSQPDLALNTGYLDDEVILSIGLDDAAQSFARATAETLLQCMRLCPGVNAAAAAATGAAAAVAPEG